MVSTLSILPVAISAIMIFAPAINFARAETASAAPDAGLKATGPFIHDKLAIYLLHGPSEDGPVPLTLSEALAKKLFVVHETGNVQALAIENLGVEAVFLQAGDIVKGGRQDRVLTTSVVVPPRSGRMPVDAYCVEQSRWSARGTESVATFDSSERSVPSRKAKLAMMARPAAPAERAPSAGQMAMRAGGGDRQHEVWASVAETQAQLSANLGAPVASAASASSLQLSLENDKLAAAKVAYLAALSPAEKDAADVVGFAFAVNGRINSADVYPSHGLFAKMWGKLIDAAATEAIGDQAAGVKPAPTSEAVLAFISNAARAAPEEHALDAKTVRVLRQGPESVASETKQTGGRMLHRSYVAF